MGNICGYVIPLSLYGTLDKAARSARGLNIGFAAICSSVNFNTITLVHLIAASTSHCESGVLGWGGE